MMQKWNDSMNINYKVEEYDYNDRFRNLEVEAQSSVKSEKFFPVFLNNGKEEIFKPLSKTKPLLTPFFAYSEVIWSTIINRYFDKETPIYRLAKCSHYNEHVPKYYQEGTIVPSILEEGEKLINLYEYFRDNPDPSVDINNYVNYCMKLYDYTGIINSKIIKERKDLGEQLAYQILLSILKADQNYHYENISFKAKDGIITKLAPSIDHEFSTMFLYLDDLNKNKYIYKSFCENLTEKESDNIKEKILVKMFKEEDIYSRFYPIECNLDIIVSEYRELVENFLERLEIFIDDLEKNSINIEDRGYIFPFNSNNYEVGIKRYKEHNEEEAVKKLKNLDQKIVDLNIINKLIQNEMLEVANLLKVAIIKRLNTEKIKTKIY